MVQPIFMCKDSRGGRGRFERGEDDLEQLESIQIQQERIRQGTAKGIIDIGLSHFSSI